MNWGNVQIKLEPLKQMALGCPIDFEYFDEAAGSSETSIESNKNNKSVRSKITRGKSGHRNGDGHVDASVKKEKPTKIREKENSQRYHPYQMNKRHDDHEHKYSTRNQFEKDRRSARRILEEQLGEPLLGKFEQVFRQYIVSVKVDGRRYFGTGRSFNEARNNAAENALKSLSEH